jgi:hypothetical protein
MSINPFPIEIQAYALGYATQGFQVFPCKPDKSPYTTHGFKDASTAIATITAWWRQWPDANIGIPTAGYTVLDVDLKNGGDKTLAELEKKYGSLPVTPTAKTGGGGRHYWFKGSTKSKANKATGLDVRSEGGYVVVPPSLHLSGSRYDWIYDLRTPMAEAPPLLTVVLLGRKEKGMVASPTPDPFTLTWGDAANDLATHQGADEGERNATLCCLVGIHIDRGDSKATVLALAKVWNKRCRPPDEDTAVEKTVASLYAKAEAKGEYQANGQSGHTSFVRHPDPHQPHPVLSDVDDTPTVPILDPTAYHGVLGEYVRLVEPQTEADPAAILVASLVAFGNACGHGPYFQVEADRHHPNLFAVCVGESGHGRKGVSLGRALALLPDQCRQNNIAQGLSSGEGLIFAVRDETTKYNAKAGVFEVLDPGVADKRLLVTETEFAQTLKVLKREGNTLSPLLRQAFDGGVLRAMTKTQTKATEPHVSIIAHVTRQELSKSLGESEYFNGFANRFLWALTRRSKLLPDGGEGVDISPLRQRVADSLDKAKAFTAMKRSAQAKALWWELYADLNKDRPGLFGACTSRAAPITLRLSMVYALADGVDVIEVKHLEAAHAVWRYCEASARLVFGDEEQADALTSEVYRLVCERPGLTKTDLINAFNRNVPAKDITRALVTLHAKGKVVCVLDKSGTGRPPERWYPAGQPHTPPPSDDAPPERKNEETSQAPANAQAGGGVHSFPRSFVAEGQPDQGEFIRSFVGDARPGLTPEPNTVLSNEGEDMDTPADDDFLAELEKMEAKPDLPKPPQGLLRTPWGFTATVTDVYDGFAKTPVDMVDGVIVTPLATLYRLVMEGVTKEQYPDLAGRFLDLKNGKVLLDVTEAELGRCTKA